MNRSVLIAPLILVASTTTTASLASEVWHCKFADVSGPNKGIHDNADVQADGDRLYWKDTPAHTKSGPWVLRLLENNEVGIVAADSQAQVNPDVGPLLGAVIVTISKSSGAMHASSAMADGPHDLWKGQCMRSTGS
jgi:hypothetical protein